MKDPIVDQAMEIWSKLSDDPKVRMEFRARKKAILDEKAAIREAELRLRDAMREGLEKGLEKGREEGREKGREEGREEANVETAKKLLRRGMDIQTISEIVGISEEELEKII